MVISDEDRSWLKVFGTLDESQKRWFAAQKAIELGRGGAQRVHDLTGMSRVTIRKGLSELRAPKDLSATRVRGPGGGRQRAEVLDSDICTKLQNMLEENTAGDPMSELKWTTRSSRAMADWLHNEGHKIGPDTVRRLLHEMDYSLQANRKDNEGGDHPQRDSQFRYINKLVKQFMATNEPVISVDAKKKEKIGDFKNGGQAWRKKGEPTLVNVYDFPSLARGTAVPYGVYDTQKNHGMVNVGVSADTGEFAVESIRQWWRRFGRRNYPKAQRLLVCADGGGSNSSTNKGWKVHLQRFANKTKLDIVVCHYPPGTSKWNKIEHRMFSYISLHWRGEPLVSYETVVNLIASTTTKKGLRVAARLDPRSYEKGVIYDDQVSKLHLVRHRTNPKWNYTVKPA